MESEFGQVSVFIPSGIPCKGCKEAIMTQEDDPVAFFCNDCDTDHIYHRDCLPPHLAEALEEYTKRENARWN